MKRRQFCKYIFTGAFFVPATGILRPKISEPFWGFQTISGKGPGTWGPNWSEASQESLYEDYCCFMDDPTDNASETGFSYTGLLTGAHLVLGQIGGIPGASGGYRAFDGTMMLSFTQTFAETLFRSGTWSIFAKVKNLGQVNNTWFFNILDAPGETENIRMLIVSPPGAFRIRAEEDNGGPETASTSSNLTFGSSNATLVGMWADGTDVIRAGIIHNYSSLPDKLSDFAANDRCALASYTGDFAGETLGHRLGIMGDGVNSNGVTGSLAWVAAGTRCFIDNNA